MTSKREAIQQPEVWVRQESGHLRANVGCFVVDGAYGGYRLERIVNDGGGVDTPFGHERYKLGEFQTHLSTILTAMSLGAQSD